MKTMIFLSMLAVATLPVLATAQQKLSRERVGINSVGITSYYIVMPVGKVLLIGRNNFVVAVIFLHNEERMDGTYSKYERFNYEKEGFRKSSEGEVKLKNPSDVGKGGWFFHHGPSDLLGPALRLGEFNLSAAAAGLNHSIVYFWSKPHKVDQKVKMAPTPWKSVEEIKLADPRIRWLAYDEKRGRKVIPVDKLWD